MKLFENTKEILKSNTVKQFQLFYIVNLSLILSITFYLSLSFSLSLSHTFSLSLSRLSLCISLYEGDFFSSPSLALSYLYILNFCTLFVYLSNCYLNGE